MEDYGYMQAPSTCVQVVIMCASATPTANITIVGTGPPQHHANRNYYAMTSFSVFILIIGNVLYQVDLSVTIVYIFKLYFL